ncbi:MAG: menaquinone biosynthesis decarboxylase [Bacteroidales bacterium]|nr:MAG: menaquinone biosynthesis decarboxylase [Bacteroidales bacterium]
MAFKSLFEFIDVLEKNNELIRVKEFVNPELEITEITDRFSKQPGGGKALFFENTGTNFPVLINLFGSTKRMCLSLGVDNLDEVGENINSLFKEMASPKESFLDKIKMLPQLKKMSDWMPTVISGKGICQQVVNLSPDLSKIPILKCWPFDGGPFVTLPMVNTKDPETGIRNVGMYRMQVFSPNETGMHWHRHKVGARHYEEYKKRGLLMPVAVALGGDPIYTYAATAPMPDNLDEYILAGFLRKRKVKLVRCITVDLEVPDDVDFVIEGYVDPREELVWEGPFGDHTGFYSLADWYPRFHVTCITHRKNAIYPATIVGVPPMEDAYIAKATERIFLSPIRLSMLPELEDMSLPMEGVAHNISVVKIKNSYPGHAYKVMNALWGAGQMMFNKIMVAVDGDVDIHNSLQLAQVVSSNVGIGSDLFFSKGPLDVLDHASDRPCFGSKLFIDATAKKGDKSNQIYNLDTERVAEELSPIPLGVSAYSLALISKGISALIVSVDKKDSLNVKELTSRLFRVSALHSLKAIILVDKEVIISNISMVIWYLAGNIEPNRDTYFFNDQEGNVAHVVFDGTRKVYSQDNPTRDWPNVVMMDVETQKRIDEKWEKLDLGQFIPSPTEAYNQFQLGGGAAVRI